MVIIASGFFIYYYHVLQFHRWSARLQVYPFCITIILTPPHTYLQTRCFVDECDSINATNEFTPVWLNNTIPWGEDFNKNLRQCYLYNVTWTSLEACILGDSGVTEENLKQCEKWVFDTSVFDSTIFSEVCIISCHFLQIKETQILMRLQFEITCDEEWKGTITAMIYMVGMMFGALTCGMVADRYVDFLCDPHLDITFS